MIRDIDRERFRLVFSATTPSTVLANTFAIIAAIFFYQRIGQAAIVVWLMAKICSATARMLHQHWHQLRGRDESDPIFQRQARGFLMVDGAIWGMAGLAALWGHDSSTLLVAISLAGVATMATFTLQAHWPFVVSYCLPMMLPAIFVSAIQKDAFGLYISCSLILLTTCLLTVSRQSESRIRELLKLRFSNAELARERESALNLAQQQMVEKSQFVATMSHELRTPLHGMLGLTKLLQSSSLPDADMNRLRLIERSGEHLLTVVNNILDFTRIEAGHLETECKAFDLRSVISDVVALSAVTAQSKHLGLSIDLQVPEPCMVMGDAARTRQVLLNLVGNAVKFTHQGEIRISVGRKPSIEYGVHPMVIRVTDTGIGIAA
ncbi:MAG TPA: histidine kinase dimerization/phospho-acceptor domain-containing protein, partial [Aquabacterium sp.]|nr:histidine kinase dimerization/phospho-acceptor domain-containing protein [Aquabacterium sp.]